MTNDLAKVSSIQHTRFSKPHSTNGRSTVNLCASKMVRSHRPLPRLERTKPRNNFSGEWPKRSNELARQSSRTAQKTKPNSAGQIQIKNSQLMHSSNSPLLNDAPICSSTFRPSPRNAKWLKKQRPVEESCVHERQVKLLGETRVDKHAFWHSSGERICKRMAVNGSRKPA